MKDRDVENLISRVVKDSTSENKYAFDSVAIVSSIFNLLNRFPDYCVARSIELHPNIYISRLLHSTLRCDLSAGRS